MEDILNIFQISSAIYVHKFSMYINDDWRLQFCLVN